MTLSLPDVSHQLYFHKKKGWNNNATIVDKVPKCRIFGKKLFELKLIHFDEPTVSFTFYHCITFIVNLILPIQRNPENNSLIQWWGRHIWCYILWHFIWWCEWRHLLNYGSGILLFLNQLFGWHEKMLQFMILTTNSCFSISTKLHPSYCLSVRELLSRSRKSHNQIESCFDRLLPTHFERLSLRRTDLLRNRSRK